MELHPTPQVRRRRPRARLLGGTALLAAAAVAGSLLLAPVALGLSSDVVHGQAMGPALGDGLWGGSLVLEDTVPAASLREGDVVSFVPPGRWADQGEVTRRVVALSDGVATTRGDARAQLDPWRLDLTTGSRERVAARLPLIGTFLQGPGLAALGGAVLVLLGLRWRRRRRTPSVVPVLRARVPAGPEV